MVVIQGDPYFWTYKEQTSEIAPFSSFLNFSIQAKPQIK